MTKLLKKEIFLVSLIVLIAAIVRLVALFNFGTYTFDDIFSVHFASMDLDEMFSFLRLCISVISNHDHNLTDRELDQNHRPLNNPQEFQRRYIHSILRLILIGVCF